MALDIDKIDDAALAILSLTLHYGDQVWKGVDWAITNRLFENRGGPAFWTSLQPC